MVLFVRLVELSDLFFPEVLSFKEGLHGRSTAAHFTLVSPLRIVVIYPCVKVSL